jgi:hypothetical protein
MVKYLEIESVILFHQINSIAYNFSNTLHTEHNACDINARLFSEKIGDA